MSLKKIGQPEPYKCKCGCHVLNGVIVKLCEGCVAGFGLIQVAKKVDGNTKMWVNLINKELNEHAKTIINESKEKKSKIIIAGSDNLPN